MEGMIRKKGLWVLCLLVLFCMPVHHVMADQDEDTPGTDVKKERKIGKWWLKNALTYDPLIDSLLFHGETEFNFLYDSGNLDRDVKVCTGLVVLRKKRISDYFSWDYQDRFAERYGDELRNVKIYELHNSIRYALSKRLTARAGIIWSGNEELGYDNRLTSYGGFAFRPVDKDMLILSVFLGAGYEDQEYTDEIKSLDERAPQIYGEFASGGDHAFVAYCHQTLTLYFSQTSGLEQSLEIVRYLDDSDDYRWNLDLGLQFQLTKHVSLVPTYSVSYTSNPLPWSEPQPWFTEKRDTSITLNLRLSI